jgi:cytochrome bd-type quinol oxidase subunit 2
VTEPALLSFCVLAALALAIGGIWTLLKSADGKPNRKQGVLMLVASLVLLGNVLIWAWPIPA